MRLNFKLAARQSLGVTIRESTRAGKQFVLKLACKNGVAKNRVEKMRYDSSRATSPSVMCPFYIQVLLLNNGSLSEECSGCTH